jgi:PAS domain S-box-containing protein
MSPIRYFSENRVLLLLVAPLLGFGIIISAFLYFYLAPPVISFVKNSTDSNLRLASVLASNLCENRFQYLLDLRLEDDPDMVSALRNETRQEIKAIAGRFHAVEIAVINDHGRIIDATSPGLTGRTVTVKHGGTGAERVHRARWADSQVRYRASRCPFWRWTVVSYIPETEYLEPVRRAKRMALVGTFSGLCVVALSLLIFRWTVHVPLRRLIKATQSVAEGDLKKVEVSKSDEMGRLADAFNQMIDSLEETRSRISSIMLDLVESELQHRLVTESSLTGIAMIKNGTFLFVNNKAAEMAGMTIETMTGTRFVDIVHPDDRERMAAKLKRLQQGETSENQFEFRYVNALGTSGWIEALAVPVYYKGELVVLGHAIDVTDKKEALAEQRKLEANLMQAQKMEAVGNLAGGMAHDFNNLLHAIQGYAETLLLRTRSSDSDTRELRAILAATQRGAELIRQLLTFCRGVEIELTPIRLNDHIERAKDLLSRTIPKMIRIDLRLNPDLFLVNADPVLIEQVLFNLAINARDAMPDGGALTIKTRNARLGPEYCKIAPGAKPGDYVEIVITDTGTGIDPETKKRIFEPFFSTKPPSEGTGLGLSTVYGIIENHEGTIHCESEPGKGTTFRIMLPAVTEAHPVQEQSVDEDLTGGAETVLLVDDEPSIRDLGQTMLTMFGYTVITAANGKTAVELYKDRMEEIDIVILDLVMPEMGGKQCLKKLKELNPEVKVIISSGYDPDGLADEETARLASSFISKPYKVGDVLRQIRQLLDNDGSPAENASESTAS